MPGGGSGFGRSARDTHHRESIGAGGGGDPVNDACGGRDGDSQKYRLNRCGQGNCAELVDPMTMLSFRPVYTHNTGFRVS